MGECGLSDKSMGADLLRASAAKGFPPAEHLLGVIARREGRFSEALPHFERAAKLGFRLAEADLGFTYMQADSPVYSAGSAYAWLSLAESRPEINDPQRQFLSIALGELRVELEASGTLELAGIEAERIQAQFGSVPAWVDE